MAWDLSRNLVPLSALPSVYANDSSELYCFLQFFGQCSAGQTADCIHIFPSFYRCDVSLCHRLLLSAQ